MDTCMWVVVGISQTSTQIHRSQFASWATITVISRPKNNSKACDSWFRTAFRDAPSHRTTSWSHTIKREQLRVLAVSCTARSSNGQDGMHVACEKIHHVTGNCYPYIELILQFSFNLCTRHKKIQFQYENDNVYFFLLIPFALPKFYSHNPYSLNLWSTNRLGGRRHFAALKTLATHFRPNIRCRPLIPAKRNVVIRPKETTNMCIVCTRWGRRHSPCNSLARNPLSVHLRFRSGNRPLSLPSSHTIASNRFRLYLLAQVILRFALFAPMPARIDCHFDFPLDFCSAPRRISSDWHRVDSDSFS